MARVLLVGYIPELLQARERTFRSAGYEITAAGALASAEAAVTQEKFDAAVLGFSIPEDQRNQIAQGLKQGNPAAKILMIYFGNVPQTHLADALLPTSASAEDILRAIHHLLKDCKRSHVG